MNRPLQILYLEDLPADCELAEAVLKRDYGPCRVHRVDTREAFLTALGDPGLGLVLADYTLPAFDGLAALALARVTRPDLPVILVSGSVGEERAVECLKHGATDYVLKSNLRRLPMVVARALAEVAEHRARVQADEDRQSLLEAASIAKVVPWRMERRSGEWIFGDSVEMVLGHPAPAFRTHPDRVEQLIHPEDAHRFCSARVGNGSDRPLGFDCRMRHACGVWIWTRWTLVHSPDHMRGVLQDVTELHATQDQLIQSQKAETAGVMVSGLSHDFNNLIQAISASADRLAASGLTDGQLRLVATIQRASGRSRELVRHLLGFARKNMDTHKSWQDLNALLEESAGLLSHVLRPDILLERAYARTTMKVHVEPGQIVQLVMNLGINAQDAIPGTGSITLRTGRQLLTSREAGAQGRCAGAYAFLEVEDTGTGIPQAILDRIFDPFFTTKPPGRGTGLGLAMVQAITKEHDGLLFCHSIPGCGTRFRILLPTFVKALSSMEPIELFV